MLSVRFIAALLGVVLIADDRLCPCCVTHLEGSSVFKRGEEAGRAELGHGQYALLVKGVSQAECAL